MCHNCGAENARWPEVLRRVWDGARGRVLRPAAPQTNPGRSSAASAGRRCTATPAARDDRSATACRTGGRASPRLRPLRGSRRLHDAVGVTRLRGHTRAADALLRPLADADRAATAARSRSSSAMRSWPSGARRSRPRTTASGPCARRSISVASAPGELDPALQARAGVLTGEAAVTIGAEGQGMVAGDLVNTAVAHPVRG